MTEEDSDSKNNEGHEDDPEGFEMVALSDDASDQGDSDEE